MGIESKKDVKIEWRVLYYRNFLEIITLHRISTFSLKQYNWRVLVQNTVSAEIKKKSENDLRANSNTIV